MGPDPAAQIRWGIGACVLTLLVVAVLAFVPDPFFRTRAVATTLDNVEGIDPGTPVSFRGIVLGKVRSVDLDPASRTFRVRADTAYRTKKNEAFLTKGMFTMPHPPA